jgi:hypothetical protein
LIEVGSLVGAAAWVGEPKARAAQTISINRIGASAVTMTRLTGADEPTRTSPWRRTARRYRLLASSSSTSPWQGSGAHQQTRSWLCQGRATSGAGTSIPTARNRPCETGLSWGMLLLSGKSSPALGRMFMARPHRRALAFLGFSGSVKLLTKRPNRCGAGVA